MKYVLEGTRVETEGDAFWIAPSAVVIGKVKLERNASIWWNAVVRGIIPRRHAPVRRGR